jgi:methylated-DNA-[protein]-cysteine S-methyltransferase
MTWLVDRFESPVGTLLVAVSERGVLHRLSFTDEPIADAVPTRDPHGVCSALARYFAGEITVIDSLTCDGQGTDFQRQVWRALRDIPAGQTESYLGLATRIGKPAAVRAVGAANGANPIALVVPCHRVIGADGSLTGYGGGLPRKKWLLAHEARHIAAGPLFAART